VSVLLDIVLIVCVVLLDVASALSVGKKNVLFRFAIDMQLLRGVFCFVDDINITIYDKK